jgi:hypothetical protein
MRLPIILLTLLVPFAAGCAGFAGTNNTSETTTGAIIGGITGALIGDHNDEPLAGALIGATAGALLGNAEDQEIDRVKAELANAEKQHQKHAVTINQLLEMTRAGVADSVIISRIHINGVAQKLTTEDVILLSESAVAPEVISAYQAPPEMQSNVTPSDDLDPTASQYAFPIVPTPTTGLSIGFDFGN